MLLMISLQYGVTIPSFFLLFTSSSFGLSLFLLHKLLGFLSGLFFFLLDALGLELLHINLVVDKIVQREDGLDKITDVDYIHVIIRFDTEGLNHLLNFQIRQEIENVLEVVHDGLVVAELAINHLLKVSAHLFKLVAKHFKA